MQLPAANSNKHIYLDADGLKIARFPVRTKLIIENDDIASIVAGSVEAYLKILPHKNKAIVVSEKAVAASQGRAYLIKDIKVSKLARFLSRFVTRTKAGIGLGMPETMQMALQEVGVPRILIAFIVAAFTKPLGLKGMFYRVAGPQARGIDGPTPYTIPPYNQSAVLAPKNPGKVAAAISSKLNATGVAIIDANDIGQNILGSANLNSEQLEVVKLAFKDNPLGQSTEQTPVAIVNWDL